MTLDFLLELLSYLGAAILLGYLALMLVYYVVLKLMQREIVKQRRGRI